MKRFTETTKWADPWFQNLPDKFKLLWLYVWDNSDLAGVWNVNLPLAGFSLSKTFDYKESIDHFNGKIDELTNNRWLIIGFIEFQYGTLTHKCPPHRRVIELAIKHGIKWGDVPNG